MTVGVLTAAAQVSLVALAWSYVGIAIAFFFVRRVILSRLIGLKVSEYLRAVAAPLGFTLVAGALASAATAVIFPPLSDGVEAGVLAAVFLGALAVQCLAFERSYFRYIWMLFRGRYASGPESVDGAADRPDSSSDSAKSGTVNA